jgi:HEAT repeat protein
LLAALGESAVHVVGAAAGALVRLMNDSPDIAATAEASLLALDDRARAWLRAVLTSATEPEARRAAAELLARSKDVEALGPLVSYLAADAPSPETIVALRAWADTGVEPLLALLSRLESAQERAVALELAADLALVSADASPQLGRVRAALRRGLTDAEPAVVVAAARCLAQWADQLDAGPLLALTRGPDHAVARAAARALESLAERAPDSVEKALSSFPLDGPHGAALAPVLATLRGPRALDRLQALMSVDDPEVRRAALHGLGRLGGERAAGHVALALADEDPEVQSVAAQVLGRIRDEGGGAPGVSGLVNAVSSEFAHVRAAVARALGQTTSQRAVPPLRELLRDPDSGVAMAAVDALGQLRPLELAESLRDALTHHDREVVKAALRALSRCQDPAAPDELIHALKHPAWDVRQLSAELIGELGVERAAHALRVALASETDDLAREALGSALRTLVGEG